MDALLRLSDHIAGLIVAADAQMSAQAVKAVAPYGATLASDAPSMASIVLPLTILVLLAVGIPVALMGANVVLSRWAHGTRNTNAAKNEQYESGLSATIGEAGEKFSVKFYLVAMLFLAFDIEVAFLYAWAYEFNRGGWGMVCLLVVFLVLLEVGYLYLYKKGALDWDK